MNTIPSGSVIIRRISLVTAIESGQLIDLHEDQPTAISILIADNIQAICLRVFDDNIHINFEEKTITRKASGQSFNAFEVGKEYHINKGNSVSGDELTIILDEITSIVDIRHRTCYLRLNILSNTVKLLDTNTPPTIFLHPITKTDAEKIAVNTVVADTTAAFNSSAVVVGGN